MKFQPKDFNEYFNVKMTNNACMRLKTIDNNKNIKTYFQILIFNTPRFQYGQIQILLLNISLFLVL